MYSSNQITLAADVCSGVDQTLECVPGHRKPFFEIN